MKYAGAFILMLFCNEIISIIALFMMASFFLMDVFKEAERKRGIRQ